MTRSNPSHIPGSITHSRTTGLMFPDYRDDPGIVTYSRMYYNNGNGVSMAYTTHYLRVAMAYTTHYLHVAMAYTMDYLSVSMV